MFKKISAALIVGTMLLSSSACLAHCYNGGYHCYNDGNYECDGPRYGHGDYDNEHHRGPHYNRDDNQDYNHD